MQLRRLLLEKKLVVLVLVLVCSALAGSTAFARTGAPRNTSRPTLSGSPIAGRTLQANLGTWTGLTPITFGYSWRRCSSSGRNCTGIGGATGPTYVLSSNDLGATIQLAVTAVNSAGSRVATSALSAVVTALSVATSPANTTAPVISGTAQVGQSLTVSAGNWNGSTPMTYGYQWKRCDGSGSNCSDVSGATAGSYTMVSADIGATVRAAVSASNSAGTASAVSAPTATVADTPPPPTDPGASKPGYFGMEPSAQCAAPGYGFACTIVTGLPRSDGYCASAVTANSNEPRPDNYTANHTVGDGSYSWNLTPYWTGWGSNLSHVDGQFTGTTSEIVQWAACKWGFDEDTFRAAAVQESYWHTSSWGDRCSLTDPTLGIGSYGLMQVKNKSCSNALMHGGYPDTTQSTALTADWYGARMRSCYDGVFYPGWLYGGQTVSQVAAAHGWDYVKWGCVGFHFSGDWDPTQSYVLEVQQHLANRTWAGF